ncbi:HEAT repeat domain-containing protein [Micromonospora sp. NPDC093244]|uniref:HEAT repeat domain-containing protein n=1 Tax=Micromonospora sp. NPDC093244 TaxID=3155071 RepID=UPI003419AA15
MPEELQPLTGPDRVLRGEALDRLVDLAAGGDERAVQALRAVVAGYRQFDPEIYTRGLNRLWLFGDATLEEPLLVALADEQYGCQAWTARACGQLGIRAAEPLLIDLLEHPDGLTRESACQALGNLSSSAAIQPLTRRLDDPAEFVRAAASEALADIGSDDALTSLWAAFESRRFSRAGYLASALARFGPAVFERLVQATSHRDPEMRFWAARALGASGDERAAEVLTRLASDDHSTTGSGARVSTAAKTALKTLRRIHEREPR